MKSGARIFPWVVATALLALPSAVEAASSRLTVTGKLTGADNQTAAVLLVANDGTSVRTNVDTNGKFTVTVPSKVAKSFVVRKSGKGATLHVLKSGEYGGPVVLGKASKTKGWTRITSTKSGTVSVGTIAMKTGYAVASAKKTVVDTASTVRMKNDAPVGSQGLLDQMLMGPVVSFGALTDAQATIGADADRDGLPNFADADMNGDGTLDATQPTSTTAFEGLSSNQALANRPRSSLSFNKILSEDDFGAQINSNLAPTVTEEQIRTYLSRNLSIEILTQLTAFDFSATSVVMDCRKLSYCTKETPGLVDRGMTDYDGKTLAEIQDADGLIKIPQRRGENVYLIRFFPGMASAAAGNLTGDTFELVTKVNDAVTASEVKVVTSSVVAPMAIAQVGTQTISPTTNMKTYSVNVADSAAVGLSFFRPQAFATGSTSALVDRGGLSYSVSIWPDDRSNTMYMCPSSTLASPTSTFRKSSTDVWSVFDSDQAPTANGTKLGFTIDMKACMAAQKSPKHTLASGQRWRIELEAQDSDSNKARVGVTVVTP